MAIGAILQTGLRAKLTGAWVGRQAPTESRREAVVFNAPPRTATIITTVGKVTGRGTAQLADLGANSISPSIYSQYRTRVIIRPMDEPLPSTGPPSCSLYTLARRCLSRRVVRQDLIDYLKNVINCRLSSIKRRRNVSVMRQRVRSGRCSVVRTVAAVYILLHPTTNV